MLFLDLDGVLVDLNGGLCKWFKKPDPYIYKDNLGKMYGPPIMGLENKRVWDGLPARFWMGLSWTYDGREILQRCEEEFGRENITICTKPTNGRCADGKMDWLLYHLPYYYASYQYVITGKKESCAHPGAFLLDDHEQNCDSFTAAGGIGWLYGRPWNKFHGLDPLGRLQGLLNLHKLNGQN